MNTATRLGSYGAALVVLAGGGYLLGGQVDAGPAAAQHSTHSSMSTPKEGDQMNMTDNTNSSLPQGLAVARGGYRLSLPATGYKAGTQTVSFQILGPDGKPVTTYRAAHEKDLHLIAVRRDFSGFQHVHPRLDAATGTWSVPLDLTSGTWRVYADFVPAGGSDLVLASDVLVPGDPGDPSLPDPQRTATVGKYTVTVTGSLVSGKHSMLDFKVTQDGKPVTTLQPYLGAYGHLVALREGDQAYLHVHPDGEPGDGTTAPGPQIGFGAEVPSPGRYHLFLDFKVDGRVYSAPFTLDAARGTTASTGDTGGQQTGSGHDNH
ncbi:hypothetical protein [Branchiibius sp. NY16-3462-2]|uniref:hypothetical protein n=1 Tax=Branchiibius sp. NY16-3462-2 TaxID=1807500 RepID=UPI0007976487|nr:hypothetical protein [Branchiibius sp. NY16-3462-2]KYH45435.1 hypothetical protein AZH51_16030 [Branchiibius sp. NY16-3462-2]